MKSIVISLFNFASMSFVGSTSSYGNKVDNVLSVLLYIRLESNVSIDDQFAFSVYLQR